MFDTSWLRSVKKTYTLKKINRQQIISLCAPLQHKAKKIIFSLQRDEDQKNSLQILYKEFLTLIKKFSYERLTQEATFRSALEEYLEAVFFSTILQKEKISGITKLKIEPDIYLGALSDVTGELVRKVTNLAAEGNFSEAKQLILVGKNIISELLEFDMTGNLRTKYDQARNNLRKLEQLNYEISTL
jgi:predicted translin family RNA/ssDNA-binding protein